MRVQLWSYNYAPEPTGIAPLSAVWAREMTRRGHRVDVVAAHPHYPDPQWGTRRRPYREVRDGIPVLRLPLWIGRATGRERIRQEISFSAGLTAAAPFVGRPDVIVAVSPSFPALGAAMVSARARRIPWVLWLQDILPDGAAATGLLGPGRLLTAARRFELAAYRSAARIVVISRSFAGNLLAKGVPEEKLTQIYNPASRPVRGALRDEATVDPRLVLTMGNIGHTQNLAAVVRAFEGSDELERLGARFVAVGDGVAAAEVHAARATNRVELPGLVASEELENLLQRAAVAVVSQRYEGLDFNVPSKLMNFMAYGIPVVAAVRGDSEVARLIEASGAGWVAPDAELAQMTQRLAQAVADSTERQRRGGAGLQFARAHFAPERTADQFEQVLREVVERRRRPHS